MIDDAASYSIRNFIPFIDEVYFRLFERQFEAWWPLHIVLLSIGAASLVLACFGNPRVVAVLMVPLLAFSSITFHFQLYAELTPVGRIFGWAFLIQIPLILLWGFVTKSRERFRPTVPAIVGLVIAVIGLVVYPLLPLSPEGGATGAAYIGMAPDATICFLLGVLLISARPVWLLLLFPIPLLWAAVTSATLNTLDAPFPMILPSLAAVAVIAAIWKAISYKRLHQD